MFLTDFEYIISLYKANNGHKLIFRAKPGRLTSILFYIQNVNLNLFFLFSDYKPKDGPFT